MLKQKISKFIYSGHRRSVKAKKNILASLGIKGISIIINLAYVPLLLDYLGKDEYGIWLTLTSIVSWFSFFDVGLGNGLRNNFAIAKANGDDQLARIYVSTTYAILTLVFIGVLLFFYLIAPWIDWNAVFNTTTVSGNSLLNLSLIVFTFFILRFVVQLIGVVLLADQRPSLNSLFNLIANIICFITIYLLKIASAGSLILLGFVLSSMPVLVLTVASLYFYNTSYKKYAPSLKWIRFRESKKLLNLGIKFFVLQISGIVMYSTTNFLITQFVSPADVAVYNVSYKMFSVFTMLYGIILLPMWSATTEAFAICDFKWIRNVVFKMQKLGVILVLGILSMVIFSNFIYHLWIGDRLVIPMSVTVCVAMSSVMYVMTGVYVAFQNGVGKIKLTLYFVIIQTILYLPIAYCLAKICAWGIIGILLAGIVCELPVKVIQVIQYRKLINGKALGLWNQ